jgi:RHS repeat-associated protein
MVTTYTYDAANRMTKVGTTNYTWDNNGNLTNDGNSLYRYDQANRMISTTLSGATTLFNYNGDGVRLKQIVNGVVTTYTQDLVASLPVVLQAKTGSNATQYLYSMGTRPVAQYGSSAWQYLLTDALGSVRQIADASGNVLLTESYEPYGKLLSSSGSGSSIFGYSGEQIDSYIKLVFLRSRYYSPDTARFLSKDSWQGDYTRPQSLDAWAYTEGNPINRTDPSGQLADPLTSEQWRLSKQEAQRFEIPTELVAGTVAVEIVHDTDLLDPLIDTYLLKLELYAAFCPDSSDVDRAVANAWLEWYNANGLSGHSGLGPGPGIANVHIKTAKEAEDWFMTYYSSQGLLTRPADFRIRLAALLMDEGNIRYVAGILRESADERTGYLKPLDSCVLAFSG